VQRRQSTHDRRRHGLFMTAAGKKELAELRREMLEHEARFTRAFSPEEFAQLFGLLHRIPRC
jgi:DNA-binding MarR family transcriptional regulator